MNLPIIYFKKIISRKVFSQKDDFLQMTAFNTHLTEDFLLSKMNLPL